MSLTYLLYRCPKCGQDPLDGYKDECACPTCGTSYSRSGPGGRIRVVEADGTCWEVPSWRLTRTLEAIGGPHPRARRGEGLSYRAGVEVRVARREEPVWHKGELQGFAERLGESREGVLEITAEAMLLWAPGALDDEEGRGPGTAAHGASPMESWKLMDIRAVQTSSRALQISPKEGGLVQFRFPEDSPKRWEELLKSALRHRYEQEGRGTILEFQPRIVTETR